MGTDTETSAAARTAHQPVVRPSGAIGGAFLVLMLAAAGLAFGWWFARSAVGAGPLPAAAIEEPAAVKAGPPPTYDTLFPDWPVGDKPQALIVASGLLHGYLQPCGCSEGQFGGLPGRNAMLKFIQSELKIPTALVDGGDIINNIGKQEQLRYGAALDSFRLMGHKMVGVGPRDLAMTLQSFMGMFADPTLPKPVLAGIAFKDPNMGDIWPSYVEPFFTQEVGGLKLGITVLHTTPDKPSVEYTVRAPTEVAPELLTKLTAAKVDLKILLLHGDVAAAKALAEKVPGFDLIVCDGVEASQTTDSIMAGPGPPPTKATRIVPASIKGVFVAGIGVWPKETNPGLRLRFQPLQVDNTRFKPDAAVQGVYARYVKAVKDADLLASVPRLPVPDGDDFAGAAKCGECHKKAYAKWLDPGDGSKKFHAHAFVSLEKGPLPDQQFNPDCVKCHVTAFGFKPGFDKPATSLLLLGNQCENCHGPGKKHAENKDDLTLRAKLRLSKANIKERCQQCHDSDNDIKFNFDTYWPRIAHPWKD